MPRLLRCWKPKDKAPLPAPQFDYSENEAAIAWGYTMSEWQQETVENRARAIAHVLHRNLREGYTNERAMDKGEKPDPKRSYDHMMRMMH